MVDPPLPQVDHAELHNWFDCLPTIRQGMAPPSNTVLKEQLLMEVDHQANSMKDEKLIKSSQFPLKQFLVFDQTGGQTTMIFNSGVGAPPGYCLPHLRKSLAVASTFHPGHDGRKEPNIGNSGTVLLDNCIDINKFDEDHHSDMQGEMHEDTEELDALMYVNDDTDTDDGDDEVTSTVCSPSPLTDNEKYYGVAATREDVASSDEEPAKRKKLSHVGNGITKSEGCIALKRSASSFDDDTESRKVCDSRNSSLLSRKKRARKDLVRETVLKLQNMLPVGKGGTPVEVIDEAISFLISLKLKASSLGFDSL